MRLQCSPSIALHTKKNEGDLDHVELAGRSQCRRRTKPRNPRPFDTIEYKSVYLIIRQFTFDAKIVFDAKWITGLGRSVPRAVPNSEPQ